MRRFAYLYLLVFTLVSILPVTMFLAGNVHAQILGFYPQADTIHIGGGCTTPIIICKSPAAVGPIDTIRLESGWNTWIWKLNEYGEEELIDSCFFLVLDSLNKFDYEIWYQSEKPLPSKRIQVQFDSSFYCEEYVFRLELLVKEAQIAIDSVFQVFKAHVGIGVKNSRGNISRPQSYNLLQNYPNSFNSCTQISFSIPKRSQVKIAIYNLLGQLVCELANQNYAPGVYHVQWNGRDSANTPVASGVYFYILTTDTGVVAKRKMLLLR